MDSKIWGPYFWFTLHTITLSYPDKPTYENKRQFNDFFMVLQHVIPCNVCKEHYIKHISNFPISTALDSKEHLVMWLFNLHNMVNRELKKKEITFLEFQEKYRKIYSPTIPEKIINPSISTKWFKIKLFISVSFILSCIFGIYYYYQRNRFNRRLFFNIQ